MMKDKSFYILVTAILLLSSMALMLIVFLHQADEVFEGSITVEENGITETTIPVRDLILTPGVQKDYHVNLICQASGHYFIHLDYQENHDGGMKEFVDVIIELDGAVVFDGPLTDLLDGGKVIETDGELHADEPLVVSFKYKMPIDTGNEAQGTSSDFDIHVIIEKE